MPEFNKKDKGNIGVRDNERRTPFVETILQDSGELNTKSGVNFAEHNLASDAYEQFYHTYKNKPLLEAASYFEANPEYGSTDIEVPDDIYEPLLPSTEMEHSDSNKDNPNSFQQKKEFKPPKQSNPSDSQAQTVFTNNKSSSSPTLLLDKLTNKAYSITKFASDSVNNITLFVKNNFNNLLTQASTAVNEFFDDPKSNKTNVDSQKKEENDKQTPKRRLRRKRKSVKKFTPSLAPIQEDLVYEEDELPKRNDIFEDMFNKFFGKIPQVSQADESKTRSDSWFDINKESYWEGPLQAFKDLATPVFNAEDSFFKNPEPITTNHKPKDDSPTKENGQESKLTKTTSEQRNKIFKGILDEELRFMRNELSEHVELSKHGDPNQYPDDKLEAQLTDTLKRQELEQQELDSQLSIAPVSNFFLNNPKSNNEKNEEVPARVYSDRIPYEEDFFSELIKEVAQITFNQASTAVNKFFDNPKSNEEDFTQDTSVKESSNNSKSDKNGVNKNNKSSFQEKKKRQEKNESRSVKQRNSPKNQTPKQQELDEQLSSKIYSDRLPYDDETLAQEAFIKASTAVNKFLDNPKPSEKSKQTSAEVSSNRTPYEEAFTQVTSEKELSNNPKSDNNGVNKNNKSSFQEKKKRQEKNESRSVKQRNSPKNQTPKQQELDEQLSSKIYSDRLPYDDETLAQEAFIKASTAVNKFLDNSKPDKNGFHQKRKSQEKGELTKSSLVASTKSSLVASTRSNSTERKWRGIINSKNDTRAR